MLASIVRFSIRFRGVVIGLAALVMLYGIYQLSRAGLDIFPEFSPKLVIIQTEAPGYSPEQVELLVTKPVENALNGTIGVENIRSESIQGLSIVNPAVFKYLGNRGQGGKYRRNHNIHTGRLRDELC